MNKPRGAPFVMFVDKMNKYVKKRVDLVLLTRKVGDGEQKRTNTKERECVEEE